MAEYRLGIIGVGAMGSALAEAFVRAGKVEPQKLAAFDVDGRRLASLAERLGIVAASSNAELVGSSEAVLIAVKPQQLAECLEPLRDAWRSGQLVISIAAGVSIATMKKLTREDCPVARVMPNILCLVRQAASAVAFSEDASDEQKRWVLDLFSAAGFAAEVEEKLMDAVTGLSGSGPAFVAVVIEALADGGVAAGLPRDLAYKLAAQTVAGAGAYVLERGELPAALKDRVSSPGGTTIAGLRKLEEAGVRSGLIEAVVAAARRSRELAQGEK